MQLKRTRITTQTSVFLKRTHRDRYLDFNSHHPDKALRGILQCLTVRAEKICDDEKRWQEIQHLRQVLRANGYPESVVKSNLRCRLTPTNVTMESQTPSKLLHLQYVKGNSECIERMCRPLEVNTVMKSPSGALYSESKAGQTGQEEGCSL